MTLFETGVYVPGKKKSFGEDPWARRAVSYNNGISNLTVRKWNAIIELSVPYTGMTYSGEETPDLIAPSGDTTEDVRAQIMVSDDSESD